jgi:hypothetical protein
MDGVLSRLHTVRTGYCTHNGWTNPTWKVHGLIAPDTLTAVVERVESLRASPFKQWRTQWRTVRDPMAALCEPQAAWLGGNRNRGYIFP